MVWLKLVVNITSLLVAGTYLSTYADVVAEKTELGRTWVGTVFLGAITSMPELSVGLGAIFVAKNTDLTSGDILGSCLFNILIFAFIVTRLINVSAVKKTGILLAGMFGILLIALASIGIFLGKQSNPFQVGWVGMVSIIIIFIYLSAVRLLYGLEKQRTEELIELEAEELNYEHISALKAYTAAIVSGLLVIGLGIWLSSIGKEIADITGWGNAFVGTLFLAVATSMPEIVVTVGAVRLGAIEMATANLFGSNIFNIAILSIEDVAYFKSNIWRTFSISNIFTAIAAIIMTVIGVLAILHPPRSRKKLGFNWQGIALMVTYLTSVYLIFILR